MKLVQEFSLRHLVWLGLLISSAVSLTGCSKDDSDTAFGDAVTTTPEQLESLADFFNGKSEQNANRAADVAASNMQTNLLIGILAVGVLILIVVLIKNKKKN
jgi:hypothetical protein